MLAFPTWAGEKVQGSPSPSHTQRRAHPMHLACGESSINTYIAMKEKEQEGEGGMEGEQERGREGG